MGASRDVVGDGPLLTNCKNGYIFFIKYSFERKEQPVIFEAFSREGISRLLF